MKTLRSTWLAVPACNQPRRTLCRHSFVMASATQNAKERAATDKAIPQQSTAASEVKLPEAGGVSYQPRLDVIPLRHTKVFGLPLLPCQHWNILARWRGSPPASGRSLIIGVLDSTVRNRAAPRLTIMSACRCWALHPPTAHVSDQTSSQSSAPKLHSGAGGCRRCTSSGTVRASTTSTARPMKRRTRAISTWTRT